MLTLPEWIQDHAILSHLEGTSTEDVIFINGQAVPVENGTWRASFANGDLLIEDADDRLRFQDVRRGLVILAAGQSNMEWPAAQSCNEEEIRRRLQGRDISWLQVPRITYPGQQVEEDFTWRRLRPENVGDVSAVALLAALELETEEPIGLVGCYKGGSSAASWVTEEDLAQDPALEAFYVTEYWQDVQDQTDEEEDRRRAEFDRQVEDYNRRFAAFEQAHPELDRAAAKEIMGHTPFPGPKGKKDFLRPSGLYHMMFERLKGLQPDVMLWYQGEEDTKFARGYASLLSLLLARWRRQLEKPDLPVVIAQLPGYRESVPEKDWGRLRLCQQQVADQDPDAWLVCLLDAGDHDNIHPLDKRLAGQRLGRMAGKILGLNDWPGSPRMIRREGDQVVFDQLLDTGSNRAVWTGSYGLENDPKPRFFGLSGLPAFPFDDRKDD